jgi:hypothetical protein
VNGSRLRSPLNKVCAFHWHVPCWSFSPVRSPAHPTYRSVTLPVRRRPSPSARWPPARRSGGEAIAAGLLGRRGPCYHPQRGLGMIQFSSGVPPFREAGYETARFHHAARRLCGQSARAAGRTQQPAIAIIPRGPCTYIGSASRRGSRLSLLNHPAPLGYARKPNRARGSPP